MPKGVYTRTEKHRIILSETRKKWNKENPEASHENASKAGKASVRKCNSLKKLWENDRERMMVYVNKYCPENGKASKSLERLWENNRDEMINVVCSKAGKIGGKNNWKKNHDKMFKVITKAGKKSIKNQQRLNPSPLELIVRKYLDKLRIKFQPNVWFPYNGSSKEADIVIPKLNLIIECDGFGHDFPEGKKNDVVKDKLFDTLGYKVLRLKGKEIRNDSFKRKLLNLLKQINPERRILTRLEDSVSM